MFLYWKKQDKLYDTYSQKRGTMIIMMTKINWRNQKLEILCCSCSLFIQEDHFNWTDGMVGWMDEWMAVVIIVCPFLWYFFRIQRISSNYIFVFHKIGLILVVFLFSCSFVFILWIHFIHVCLYSVWRVSSLVCLLMITLKVRCYQVAELNIGRNLNKIS